MRSGGDVVLVGESAEDLLPADPVLGKVDRFRRTCVCLGRGELAEGTVRPAGAVMPQVPGQHPSQVALIDDQQPVEDLPAQGAMILSQIAFALGACGGLAGSYALRRELRQRRS
jgi:hypothetical protein